MNKTIQKIVFKFISYLNEEYCLIKSLNSPLYEEQLTAKTPCSKGVA